jgi:protein HIRA/HIR1
MDIDGDGNAKGFKTAVRLPIPPLRTSVSAKIEDRESDVFEGKNSEDGTSECDALAAHNLTLYLILISMYSVPPEVCLTVGKNVEFIDFVSSNVIAVAASSLFCAAALEDGSVNVYSHSGRRIVGASSCGLGACQRLVILYRLMPSLVLDSVCIEMDACRSYLMAITSAARVYVW